MLNNEGYSLADIAAATGNEGFGGGNGAWWIIILFLFAFMNGGFGTNRVQDDYGQYATAASQQQILFGQQFQNLYDKVDKNSNGICDMAYALNSSIRDVQSNIGTAVTGEGRALQQQLANCCCETSRNIDALRFDLANYNSATLAAIREDGEATRKMLYENKIETLQNQINQLQLQNAVAGVVRYPTAATYNAGYSPYCNAGTPCMG